MAGHNKQYRPHLPAPTKEHPMNRTHRTAASPAAPSLIRWGAVVGGVILGMSLLLLLASLWVAIGFGAGTDAVADNLEWFLAGSAVVAMFVGGYLAGWLSGVPGTGPGFFNGLTVWGAILIGSLAVGIPGALNMVTIDPNTIAGGEVGVDGQALWAPFVSLLIGAIAAGLGGVLGGATTRPATAYTDPVPTGVTTRTEDREVVSDDTRTDRTDDARRIEYDGARNRSDRTVDLREDEVHAGRERDTR
jgi:hypothetical protein